jgi:hypothetical protein
MGKIELADQPTADRVSTVLSGPRHYLLTWRRGRQAGAWSAKTLDITTSYDQADASGRKVQPGGLDRRNGRELGRMWSMNAIGFSSMAIRTVRSGGVGDHRMTVPRAAGLDGEVSGTPLACRGRCPYE